MNRKGFSLVELVLIVAIIGTLLAIGTLNFSEMNKKSGMETQVKKLYADLQETRQQALYTKRPRSVVFSSGALRIYSSSNVAVAPQSVRTLPHPTVWEGTTAKPEQIDFDTWGVAFREPPDDGKAICIEPAGNPASYDSVVVYPTMVKIGKRKAGESCASAKITIN